MVALDWLMIVLYFALLSGLTWWSVARLTYATITPEQRLASRRSWNNTDVFSSAVVLALIAAAYLYFNG